MNIKNHKNQNLDWITQHIKSSLTYLAHNSHKILKKKKWEIKQDKILNNNVYLGYHLLNCDKSPSIYRVSGLPKKNIINYKENKENKIKQSSN